MLLLKFDVVVLFIYIQVMRKKNLTTICDFKFSWYQIEKRRDSTNIPNPIKFKMIPSPHLHFSLFEIEIYCVWEFQRKSSKDFRDFRYNLFKFVESFFFLSMEPFDLDSTLNTRFFIRCCPTFSHTLIAFLSDTAVLRAMAKREQKK